MLSNIAHNTDPDRSDVSWIQATAFTGEVKASEVVRLRRVCTDRAREMVESLDDLFISHEKRADDGPEVKVGVPIAVGVFYFEERKQDSHEIWTQRQ